MKFLILLFALFPVRLDAVTLKPNVIEYYDFNNNYTAANGHALSKQGASAVSYYTIGGRTGVGPFSGFYFDGSSLITDCSAATSTFSVEGYIYLTATPTNNWPFCANPSAPNTFYGMNVTGTYFRFWDVAALDAAALTTVNWHTFVFVGDASGAVNYKKIIYIDDIAVAHDNNIGVFGSGATVFNIGEFATAGIGGIADRTVFSNLSFWNQVLTAYTDPVLPASPTDSPTPTITETATPTWTPTATPTWTPTATKTHSPTITKTATKTASPTASPTATKTPTKTPIVWINAKTPTPTGLTPAKTPTAGIWTPAKTPTAIYWGRLNDAYYRGMKCRID